MVECLLLQELVTDGVEGDGQTASEEQDKVDGQLVPEKKHYITIIFYFRK